MPNAALLILTSPLLLADAPQPTALPPETPRIATLPMLATGQARRAAPLSTGVINLQWSLGAVQAAGSSPDQSGTQPDQTENTQDDAPPPEGENVIVVTGEYGPPESDPIAEINEESYRITQQLDETFVEPVAYAYRDGLPDPIRDGLGNVVRNLGEPNNALNFLLQGKFGKAFETLGRLLINSSLGIGGLIDIAEKPGIGLPYRRNGFGNTLGYYGVGPGPYLYLPVTGATTARDLIGSGLDQLLLPVAVGKPFNEIEFTATYFVISNLDSRLEFDEELGRIEETIDPYAARRDSYLYRRERDIALLKGEEPPDPPLIMEEVEGTGDFADPPPADDDPAAEDQPLKDQAAAATQPASPLVITRPR